MLEYMSYLSSIPSNNVEYICSKCHPLRKSKPPNEQLVCGIMDYLNCRTAWGSLRVEDIQMCCKVICKQPYLRASWVNRFTYFFPFEAIECQTMCPTKIETITGQYFKIVLESDLQTSIVLCWCKLE